MLINKNNQTTSTKCQYHAAHSKPRCRKVVKWYFIKRIKQIKRKIVPMITCNPWKPVAKKKMEPYTLSFILNGQWIYSKTWHDVKTTPRTNVMNKPFTAISFCNAIIARWANVNDTPDDNKINVFKNGIPHGFITVIPKGGHIEKIEIAGEILKWKNDQKKKKKNKISDTMKNNIPFRKLFKSTLVWKPERASLITDENQEYNAIDIKIKPLNII